MRNTIELDGRDLGDAYDKGFKEGIMLGETITKQLIEIQKWLYDNYLPILREYEATKGNLRIEFAGGENGLN